METATLIISSVILVISVICFVIVFRMLKKIENTKHDSETQRKMDELKESVYNEFSRNRSEQNQAALVQRRELEAKIAEINSSLEKLNSTNQEQLVKILREVSVGLSTIRDKNAEIADRQSLKIETALDKIRESNEKKLEEMRTVVDEKMTATLTQRLDSSFKTVSDQLENLYKALGEMKEMSGGITEHVSSLNRVLSNVKARGTWAEVQLQNILDQTIPGMYVENYAPSSRSKDRVEFAIKIPSGEKNSEITYLPLDSKFPMEDYVRLCDATDRADVEAVKAARKALEERVISEARSIKKYINVPKTTPFAIMYLASEGLYAEIASSSNAIPERLQTEFNVMVAGPSTITALLNSLSLGFRIAAINEKAAEVRKILSAVKTQYDKFAVILDKAKKKIDDAGKTLDEAKRKTDFIQSKLRTIEVLDTDEADQILMLEPGETIYDDEE